MLKLICCYHAFYLFLFFLHFQAPCSSSLPTFSPKLPKSCLPKESSALLQFKTTFSINDPLSRAECCNPKTLTWKQGNDCCLWDGVTCDALTGHVIALDLSCGCLYGSFSSNSTLFHLSHIQRLNLADNDFNFSPIPPQFGLLAKLTHLRLSGYSSFLGKIPPEISHLSRMVSLDICLPSGSLELEMHSFQKLSRNLTELRVLNLCGVVLSSISPMSLLNLSSSLRSLRLQNCILYGKLPDNIFQFPSLEVLDLSSNQGVTGNFPNSNWSSPLRSLILFSMALSGELPNSIRNLTSLEHLDLGSNNFVGKLPNSIGNLKFLEHLDLGSNKFSGDIANSISNLKSLVYLDLRSNDFFGEIPNSIGNLKSMKYLDLSFNNFSGEIPDSIGSLESLESLDLNSNNFYGQLPFSVFNLTQLSDLDFSVNQLVGALPFSIPQAALRSLDRLSLLLDLPCEECPM